MGPFWKPFEEYKGSRKMLDAAKKAVQVRKKGGLKENWDYSPACQFEHFLVATGKMSFSKILAFSLSIFNGVLFQIFQTHNAQRRFVCGFQINFGSHAGLQGFTPSKHAEAPFITFFEAGESVLGHWR